MIITATAKVLLFSFCRLRSSDSFWDRRRFTSSSSFSSLSLQNWRQCKLSYYVQKDPSIVLCCACKWKLMINNKHICIWFFLLHKELHHKFYPAYSNFLYTKAWTISVYQLYSVSLTSYKKLPIQVLPFFHRYITWFQILF